MVATINCIPSHLQVTVFMPFRGEERHVNHASCDRAESFVFTSIRPQTFIHQLSLIIDVLGSPKAEEVSHIRNKKAKMFLRSKRQKMKVMSSKRRLGSCGARSCSLHFVPPRSSCLARSTRDSVVMNQFVVSTGTFQRIISFRTGAGDRSSRRSSCFRRSKASIGPRGP